jgi:hypothetical protein
MGDADELLTPAEAADFLKLPPGQLAQLRHRGQGPAYSHLGRSVRYAMSDLRRWVKAGRVDPAAKR